MAREPLDSIEYESTYLELRPASERLSDTIDAPILVRRRAHGRGDDAFAPHGIAAADDKCCCEPTRPATAPPARPMISRSGARYTLVL